MMRAIFMISEGWILMPTLIHRREPLMFTPMGEYTRAREMSPRTRMIQ